MAEYIVSWHSQGPQFFVRICNIFHSAESAALRAHTHRLVSTTAVHARSHILVPFVFLVRAGPLGVKAWGGPASSSCSMAHAGFPSIFWPPYTHVSVHARSHILVPFGICIACRPPRREGLGGAGLLLLLHGPRGLPLDLLATLHVRCSTRTCEYVVPNALHAFLMSGYIHPNLPPPAGLIWRAHAGKWKLVPRRG